MLSSFNIQLMAVMKTSLFVLAAALAALLVETNAVSLSQDLTLTRSQKAALDKVRYHFHNSNFKPSTFFKEVLLIYVTLT